MYLVDSDFDTEDEAYGDDIEEVISNHIADDSGEQPAPSSSDNISTKKPSEIGLKELQEKLGCEIIGAAESELILKNALARLQKQEKQSRTAAPVNQ